MSDNRDKYEKLINVSENLLEFINEAVDTVESKKTKDIDDKALKSACEYFLCSYTELTPDRLYNGRFLSKYKEVINQCILKYLEAVDKQGD